MSLVSYLPPLPTPLHTSQLTETWQWPTCMCWQPKLTLLFWSHLLGLGKVLPLLLFHSWSPLGIQYCPVPLEPGLPLRGMHEAAHLLCGHPDSSPPFSRCNPPPHLTPGAVMGLPGPGSDIVLEQLQKQSAISCLFGSLFPCPNTHAGWPLLPSVTLPCCAGAAVGVCNLLCITCTVSLSYLSTGCFS